MNGMLTMSGIVKSFPGVLALQGVDFEVKAGEIHALLGANGAGKSTLMKILSGAYTADAGTIAVNGEKVAIRSPLDAKRAGIQCVYQEVDTALVPNLSVAENLMLDRLSDRNSRFWIDWGEARREAERLLKHVGATVPVDIRVGELPIAQKQLVLLARALGQKANTIIFDEPTAPLSLEETQQLFRTMNRLKSEGVGCVFISHRLPEVFEISDRITVMRDGKRVGTVRTADASMAEIVEMMLGKPVEEEFPKREVAIGETLLEVRGLRGGKVKGVDLTVRRGEIVGIVGLVGAGKTELSRLLFGADPLESGTVRLSGKEIRLTCPADAIREGIVLVPEERRTQGIMVGESVKVNLTLPILKRFAAWGWIRGRAEAGHADAMVRRLGVKTPHAETPVGHLSGGNQQKVAIGKWLPTDSSVYLFDEPTKGIDVGAKSDLFRLVGDLAEKGKGIVYLSAEIPEILGISDRVLVMCDGKIVKELKRGEATEETILYFASAGEERGHEA